MDKSTETHGTEERVEKDREGIDRPACRRCLHADVLVVEDTRIYAAQLTRILEEEECSVRLATNGVEALELLLDKLPDIIISDIVMPEMDGYELCRRVKRDPKLAQIPVVLVTTLTDPEDILKGLESGADNLVPKPFRRDYLVSRVRQSLENASREDEGMMGGVMVDFAGHEYYITAKRLQIINLLLSTYETAVQKNAELARANQDLIAAQETLASQAEALRDLSLRDELTGLYNRRGFTTLAEHELKVACRTQTRLAAFYLDLDNLKHINDTFGHSEGDKALVALAEALSATFRDSDIIARLGGDEFVVLEIGASPENAESAAGRLDKELRSRVARDSLQYDLAASVGAASFDPKDPVALADLLDAADAAMYEQKKSRNRRP